MPAGRKFRKSSKKSNRKSGGFLNRKYSAMDLAKSAYKGVKYIRGLVNSELYKKDTTLSGGITDAGALLHVTDVAQGDGSGARTGNSLFIKSLNWKGQAYRSTAGNAAQAIKLAVVMDTQQIGDTTPSYTDVWSAANCYSHLNANTVGRFRILATKNIALSVTGDLIKNFEFNIPMEHHVRYNGSASTDVQKGGLYIAYITDQSGSNYPVLASECRISYHDN